MMGTALGGVGYAEEQFVVFMSDGIRNVSATLATNVFGGAASCNVAIEFGVQGPNSTNAMSCASGTMAIGEAFRQIRDDYADVMICGGAEAPLNQLCFGAFAIIRAMSTRNDDPAHASRPFDRERDGFVMGEGAAMLVLEEYERAKARGAHIYAEVVGLRVLQRRAPHDGAASRRLAGGARDPRRAARRARRIRTKSDTSTPMAAARRSTTPPRRAPSTPSSATTRRKLQVSSTKAYYGHALGASGAMEAAICAMSLEQRLAAADAEPRRSPARAATSTTSRTRAAMCRSTTCVNNSFGFGGINAALVLKRAGRVTDAVRVRLWTRRASGAF